MQNYVHISDNIVPQRAFAVLPTVLQFRQNIVSPRKSLSARIRFGPVEGVRKEISQASALELVENMCQTRTPLFLIRDNCGNLIHIDVSDKDKTNWLCLLPLGDQDTANVWLYEDNNELYAITTLPIGARKQLFLGYSKKYTESHGLPTDLPTLDIEAETSSGIKKWWCYDCQHGSPSAALLQRHIDTYHKDKASSVRRQRYNCRHCTRKFSRLHSLKRHMLSSCFKKVPEKSKSPDKPADPNLDTITNTKEDSRVPSDESFNNYSNGLDFPTNLFDTDRIPGLDMSSRYESEFNSFVIEYKDDSCLGNDLGFGKASVDGEIAKYKAEETQHDECCLVACQYCNKIIEKTTKRQHLRECTWRRFECECGRTYTNKKKLIQHINTEHCIKGPPGDKYKIIDTLQDSNTTKSTPASYRCEKCQHSFKRRGMLVNHLWRIHEIVSAAVPLERPVRYYLCLACAKMYRTAAKRDRHIRIHHPGVEKECAKTIEGAMKVCEPAACTKCPRQYATRAKLLQHMRQHHPHLASEQPPKPEASETELDCTAEETDKNQIALQRLLSIY